MLAATLFECLTGKDCKHQILKRLRNASTLYYPEKVLRHFEGFSNELQHQPEQATPALLYAFPGLYLCRYCKHFARANAAYPGSTYRRCSGCRRLGVHVWSDGFHGGRSHCWGDDWQDWPEIRFDERTGDYDVYGHCDALDPSVPGFAGGAVCSRYRLRVSRCQHIPTVPRQKEGSQQQGIQTTTVFRQALLWLMALQLGLYVGAEVGFSSWIVTAVSQSAFISLALAAPSATAFWTGMTIGRLLGAQVLKRGILSEKQLLYVSIISGGASGLIVAAFVRYIGVSFGASLLAGLFFGPIFPGVMAIASRWFVHTLGAVSSVMLISAGVAGMILPVLMGFLIADIGLSWVMAIPALVCLAIVVPFSLALRRQRLALQLPADTQVTEEESSVYR